jgi:hypothetical protein
MTGLKYDSGKLRFDLISVAALEDLAAVYTYGVGKYSANNWRKGFPWSRIFAALMRHAWAFWRGEDLDPESGLPHLAHCAWQCFTLLEFMRTYPELDDRYEIRRKKDE